MSDFKILKQIHGKYVISAPRRAVRPDAAKGATPECPFCPGSTGNESEVYRVGGEAPDTRWQVKVIPNKFPFAPIHEVIIHAPDHHKNIDELPISHVRLLLQTYRQRFNTYRENGLVYIFHNRGFAAGESVMHPHTQLAVIPSDTTVSTPPLLPIPERAIHTPFFSIFCPYDSEWPDEMWVAPIKSAGLFGDIKDEAIDDLAFVLQRLIYILTLRHGHEFSFNFYIYPKEKWYIRLIPRQKTLGGFELSSGIMVNTQKPEETFAFLEEHFAEPDEKKIKELHTADYEKQV